MADRRAVITLYKELMRYAGQLKLSDRDYVRKYIRQVFERNRTLTDPEALRFFYNKGLEVLKLRHLL
ncbi:hypothetical protein FGIG_06560 [Fasciola gigantica]|uniref:Complex 1 LYR protein domain-containing protein n=1 Tax=Fasciola gigantica TaxID=46835 RepID=A0A504YCP1_FASGI|nr:hypothetical protein FGIG_06560 [Fasciola gigantica]